MLLAEVTFRDSQVAPSRWQTQWEVEEYGYYREQRLPRPPVLPCCPRCRDAVCTTSHRSILVEGSAVRNEDKIDIIFPIPSIQRASDSNQPPPMHPPGSAPPVFETSPDDMLPVPIEIDLSSIELTRAIKNQLKAHVLATLAVDARRGSGDEATVKEDIKNLAMAALMVEKEEREDEKQDGKVNAKAGTLEGEEKDQSEEMDEEVDNASVKAKKKSNVTKE